MSLIEIRKVENKKDLKTFIDFHYDLYEGNEYDVPNLFSDEMNTLSKDRNAAFEFCESEYFLAYKDGKCRCYHQPQGQRALELQVGALWLDRLHRRP